MGKKQRDESDPDTRTLTPKELHFARCVAQGMSQSDAYREAYNVGEDTLAKTVTENASRKMADSNVRARVEYLIMMREKAVAAAALNDHERALHRIRHLTDHATGQPGEANQLRAAELLGRSVGMFKDVTLTEPPRRPEDVDRELMDRLAAAESSALNKSDTTDGDHDDVDTGDTVH